MANDVCLHCGNPFEESAHPAPVRAKDRPLHLCLTCLGEALRGVLNVRNSAWVRGASEAQAASFCWLCGETTDRDKRHNMTVGRAQREIVVCQSCYDESAAIALRAAGLPPDWRKLPRKCGACEHCRDGECCYEIPTVVMQTAENGDGEDLPGAVYPKTCRPLVRPHGSTDANDFGCGRHWAPRIQREE